MTSLHDSERSAPSPPRAEEGRALAMTVFSLVRPVFSLPPGGAFLQRFVFAIGRRKAQPAIHDLSMIHFARFSLIDKLPDLGQEPERLRQPLQLFESNYNITFDHYIDTFVDRIPREMHALWGWSYGFPWHLKPTSRFKTFIHRNEFDVEHYYAAYPEATVTMIEEALALMEPHEAFHRRVRELDPEDFFAAYLEFLTRVQEQL
jgi:hypothetical protein